MSESKQQTHRIVSILQSIQAKRLETILSHLKDPDPSSILQTWYFISAALLAPAWLCSAEQIAIKKKLQQALLQHPIFIQELLTKYNIDTRWQQGSCPQEDLIESFAALAVFIDMCDSPLAEDSKIFLQYTHYIFSANPFDFSQSINHAKLLIKELALDFGYVADYLEDIADNEHLLQQSALSLEETEACLSSWIKQQYDFDVNLQRWLQQLAPSIHHFITSQHHASGLAMHPLWCPDSNIQFGIAVNQRNIYFYWRGANPPIDIHMGQTTLLPELSQQPWQEDSSRYWRLPDDPCQMISFHWKEHPQLVDLTKDI